MSEKQRSEPREGEQFPNILLSLRGEDVHLHERLRAHYAVILGVTGAFTKRANALVAAYKFVSQLIDQDDQRLAFVACLAVNDPFVLKAWAKRLRITNELVFIADSNGTLTRGLGLQVADDVQQQFGGGADARRCRDFVAIVAPGGVIQRFFLEDYTVQPIQAIFDLFAVEPTAAQTQSIETLLAKARPPTASPTSSPRGAAATDHTPTVSPGLTCALAPTPTLLPFVSTSAVIIKDLSKPSVFFDYDMSAGVKSVHAELLPGQYTYKITAPDSSELGSLRIELDRQNLFDPRTGVRLDHIETPRKLSAEIEFDVSAIYIDCARAFPLSGAERSIATLCIVHRPYQGRDNNHQCITFAVPLVGGGRDNFIAAVAGRSGSLVAEPNLQLQKYISSYMSCYRYCAPCIYEPTTRAEADDIWIVSKEVCYVDERHVDKLRVDAAEAAAAASGATAATGFAAECAFLIAAD